jgi:hypothetical protein
LSRGYSSFKNIEDPDLRGWNRLMTYLTIVRDIGTDQGSQYLGQFEHDDQKKIIDLSERIKREGLNNVKKSILRSEEPNEGGS